MPLVDFSKAVELTPLEPGTYSAILEEYEYHPTSQSSGKPYVSLKFAVTDGEYEGRVLYRNHSLQDKAMWAFKRTLTRLGASETELTAEAELEDIMPSVIGAECKLKVTVREYKADEDSEPRMVNDVQEVLSAFAFK